MALWYASSIFLRERMLISSNISNLKSFTYLAFFPGYPPCNQLLDLPNRILQYILSLSSLFSSNYALGDAVQSSNLWAKICPSSWPFPYWQLIHSSSFCLDTVPPQDCVSFQLCCSKLNSLIFVDLFTFKIFVQFIDPVQ